MANLFGPQIQHCLKILLLQNLSKEKINQCFSSENKKTEYEKGSYFGTYRYYIKTQPPVN